MVIFEIRISNLSDRIHRANLSKVGPFKNSIGKIKIMIWIPNEFMLKVYIIFEASFITRTMTVLISMDKNLLENVLQGLNFKPALNSSQTFNLS